LDLFVLRDQLHPLDRFVLLDLLVLLHPQNLSDLLVRLYQSAQYRPLHLSHRLTLLVRLYQWVLLILSGLFDLFVLLVLVVLFGQSVQLGLSSFLVGPKLRRSFHRSRRNHYRYKNHRFYLRHLEAFLNLQTKQNRLVLLLPLHPLVLLHPWAPFGQFVP
jgi:hypothetical protein